MAHRAGEWEGLAVFVVTPLCGHTHLAYTPGVTLEGFKRMYGGLKRCPDCTHQSMQDILDEVDYRLNPDT